MILLICYHNGPANDLARHGRLGDVDEGLFAKRVDLDRKLILQEFDGFFASQTIACNHSRRVNLVLDEVVGSA